MDDGQILDNATLKDNLLKARLASGLTQAKVAKLLDISLPAYQNIEHGKTRILNENYLKCAELFGVSSAELVNGYEPVRNATTIFTDLKQSYGDKMIELEKHYINEIQIREMEIRRLRESIQDKDRIISTQELLIERLTSDKD
jgi:transcriptional regulator with XRE-family HTH domain